MLFHDAGRLVGPQGQMAVAGDGPIPARVMFIGEAPAYEEVKQGRPFVGLSGQVLWQFAMRHASLLREDVYVTNLCKHQMPEKNGKKQDPTPADIEYWTPELMRELEIVQPDFVVTLGLFATRWFLAGAASMEEVYGLPWPSVLSAGLTVIPVHHPAAGLHNGRLLPFTSAGFEAAGEIVRGGGPGLPVDAHPEPLYAEQHNEMPWALGPVVAIDTEGWRGEPDTQTLQWSDRPGTGWLIRATNRYAMLRFREALVARRPLIVHQNGLHDFAIEREMGLDVLGMGLSCVDTLAMAYNDQLLPGGLKPMARRLCGMQMENWKDVVGVHDDRIVRDYLGEVVLREDEWPAGVGRKHGIVRLAKARLKADVEEKSLRERWNEIDTTLRMPVEEVLGPIRRVCMYDVPAGEFLRYAARDPDATLRVYHALKSRIVAAGLVKITKLDNAVMPYTDRMQEVGMPVDAEKIAQFGAELEERIRDLGEVIGVVTEGAISNPGSSQEIEKWCQAEFARSGKCALVKPTASRERLSTDDEALQRIKDDHVAIPLILERRELDKLRGSYVVYLAEHMSADGRYHPDFRLVKGNNEGTKINRALSGRLTEWLLTIPVRSEQGKRVRGLFVAPPGWKFGSADLSQLELRLIADASGDEKLIEAFLSGKDIHSLTASWMFDVPLDAVDKRLHRTPAKNINYLMAYGGDENTLHEKLVTEARITTYDLEACKGLLDRWYRLYSGVADWKRGIVEFTRRHGYSPDRYGRRRYLPSINLHAEGGDRWVRRKLESLQREAERHAVNHPVQSDATATIERAQVRLWFQGFPELWSEGIEVQPVLQFHDELIVLYRDDEGVEAKVKEKVLWAMTADTPLFKVPIESSWSSGASWADLKD